MRALRRRLAWQVVTSLAALLARDGGLLLSLLPQHDPLLNLSLPLCAPQTRFYCGEAALVYQMLAVCFQLLELYNSFVLGADYCDTYLTHDSVC